jgi:hypothetical protein
LLKNLNFTSLRKAISSIFNKIPDHRQLSKVAISLHDALMSGIACMYFQDPSLLQFQKRLQEAQHRNNLQTLFDIENIPKDTQMREIIDPVDREYFRPIFKDFHLRLQRSKRLAEYQLFPGLYLFPLDATGYFTSEKIHCNSCLEKRYHKEKVKLELYSSLPDISVLKANTYYLVDNIELTSTKYLIIHKYQKPSWQLFYIGDDKEIIKVEISKVNELEEFLKDKTIEKFSTNDKNKKRIETILTPYHDKTHSKTPITYSHQALQGGLCKALHKAPYAKKAIMQSNLI